MTRKTIKVRPSAQTIKDRFLKLIGTKRPPMKPPMKGDNKK